MQDFENTSQKSMSSWHSLIYCSRKYSTVLLSAESTVDPLNSAATSMFQSVFSGLLKSTQVFCDVTSVCKNPLKCLVRHRKYLKV